MNTLIDQRFKQYTHKIHSLTSRRYLARAQVHCAGANDVVVAAALVDRLLAVLHLVLGGHRIPLTRRHLARSVPR